MVRLSNFNALIVSFSVSAILYFSKSWLKKIGFIIPNWIIGVIGVSGLVYVIINIIFSRMEENKQPSTISLNQNTAQFIIDDTYSLYNETGLFVKHCFVAAREVNWEKSAALNEKFDVYLKTIKGRLLALPQELEVKIFRFFDMLFDYKKGGDSIVSMAKTNECYSRQQELEQNFSNEASPLYSEIEVELRKLVNKSNI